MLFRSDASPTQTEVGEKTVYYQVTADNYTTYTGSAKLTVSAKQTQNITAADVTATYGDTGKSIEASTSGDGTLSYAVKSGDAVTVNETTGALTIVKAGSAVITVTAAENDTYAKATKDVNVTVNTKAMTVTAADVNVTVDGQPHGITVNVTDPASGATVKYGTEEGSYTLEASPTQTEVGEKTVYYQVTADNYTTYTGSAKVTVSAKQTQTISAENVTATYGDTDKKVSATTDGDGAITYAVKDGSGDYIEVNASTGALTIKKVPTDGKAYVTVTAAGTATYEQATKDVTVTINKADPTVTAPTVKTLTYTGSAQELVNAGSVTGGTMYYAVTTENTAPTDDNLYTTSIPSKTDAGTYYVWYKVKGDTNHNDTEPTSVTVTITPSGGGSVTDPVADVIKMIKALDSSAADYAAKAQAAVDAYNALTDAQKDDSRFKEQTIASKLAEAQAAVASAADKKAADEASALIVKLPDDPAQATEADAQAAWAAYKALTDAQKVLLSSDAQQKVAAYKYYYEAQGAKAQKAKLKSVKAKKGKKAVAKWKKVSGVDGYQLYYKAKGVNAKKVTIKSAKTLKKTVKKLKAGKKYTFKVRTITKVYNPATGKDQNIYGKWSNVKKVKAKK